MTDEQMQTTEEEVEVLDEGSESSTEETTPAQDPESGAEPEQGAGEDKLPPEVQEKINARINQITREKWEERRKREALEAEYQKLQSRMQPQAPEVPDLPDPYSVTEDEFKAAVRERDEALRNRAAFEAKERAIAEQKHRQAQEAQRKQVEQVVSAIQGYTARAEQLGIQPQDLQVAANTITAYGLNDDVSRFILNDDQGPLITMHLASHPDELMQVSGMHPTQAAVHIATKIAPNLQARTNKTHAPPPPDTLDGGGAPPAQDGPEGAIYE